MASRLEVHPALAAPVRFVAACCRHLRFAWRFSRSVSRFDTVEREGIKLWAPRGLLDDAERERYLTEFQAALTQLATWFDVAPGRWLNVFVFARSVDAELIFGRAATGWAVTAVNGLVIVRDHLQRFAEPREVMRHELAHVLASRWGHPDPPLKGEGLAAWLQGSENGRPTDEEALARLLGERCPPLGDLLDPAWWSDDARYSYAVAGSFTGYLLRRFDVSTYRAFYARARPATFVSDFADVFGCSLTVAEREWHADLLGRRAAFEPRLSRTIGERRVEALYDRWQLYHCLDEVTGLRGAGLASGRALAFGAWSRRLLGDYVGAASLLAEALSADCGTTPSQRSTWCVMLGKIHDLDGRRASAVAAYRRALEEAGEGDDETSREARRLLEEPYRE